MSDRVIPPALTDRQHEASDPAASAWVSANAGAGKTHVLAQRVIRLLLEGASPEKILCLTFTKAAAANMANRIFNTLGAWTSLDDAGLDAAIRAAGTKGISAKHRQRARQLFASALETPGGLKVQTIHAFCTRLLQQFPFEANVPAHFSVLEETQQQQLLEQIRRDVLLQAANAPDSEGGRALAAIIAVASDFQFQAALNEAIRRRGEILSWLEAAGGVDAAMAELSDKLGIRPEDTLEDVEAAIVDSPQLPPGEWGSAAAACQASSKSDQRQGQRLLEAAAANGSTRLLAYLDIFFTGSNELRASVVTAGFIKKNPELAQKFADEQQRVGSLCEQRRAVLARDRTRALLVLAVEVMDRYAAEKNRRGVLDYEDLINRTGDLLTNTHSQWVHYKLDLGIDHVLIDEAQDTSPAQWDIIKRFVAEFTAGAGARSMVKRSIFAVGDDKQSIFSFQGAAPESFGAMRSFFKLTHEAAGEPFRSVDLHHSFRSVLAVLNAVDAVFRQEEAHKGLTVDPVPTVHEAVRENAPGLVELWDLIEPEEKEKPEEAWDLPFDTTSETSTRVKLAKQIAAAVRCWRTRGDLVGDGRERHVVRAGDILILVRQRGPLFEAIIRALKNAGVPVAGADRLVLTEHIAIMDLLALADAVLHPPDDLALATILKSPLFGMSEEDLLALAAKRDRSLLVALRQRQPERARKFDAIAQAARGLSPFAFYADLLGAGGGRKAFLARLGLEANDAIDEFLNLALDYESRETPSLQGFVAWLRGASAAVKRDMEMARDEVRVMTVHGAKGLEAPIVILADTTTMPAGPAHFQPRLLGLPADAVPDTPDRMVWVPTKKDDVAPTAVARTKVIAEAENEHRRLLYVAMTRAADRLIVCGAVGEKAMPAGCWYDLVRQGLEGAKMLIEEPADFGGGTVKRYRKFQPEGEAAAAAIVPAADGKATPSWLWHAAPALVTPQPITPSMFYDSQAPDADAIAAGGRAKALARGNLVHRLMQSLPDSLPEWREHAARQFLARNGGDFSAAEQEEIAAQAIAVLGDNRFAELFMPGSRAEVPIVGRLNGRAISGQIDRLVVTPQAVLIGDYKTNRPAPRRLEDVQRGYVAQLALYRAVLTKLYPGRPIRAALIWTEVPDIMEIPGSTLDASLTVLADRMP